MTNTTTLTVQSENQPALQGNLSTLMTQANTMVVATPEQAAEAAQFIKNIKDLEKEIKSDKEAIFRPAKTVVDEITKRYKPMLDEVAKVEKVAKDKLLKFQSEELRKQREAEEAERKRREDEALKQAQALEEQRKAEEEAMRKKAAEERAELESQGRAEEAQAVAEATEAAIQENAEAHDGVLNNMVTEASKEAEVKQTFTTGNVASTVKKVWDFELVDINHVPTEFLLLNEKAVREAIRNGERSISGVRIFQKDQLSIR